MKDYKALVEELNKSAEWLYYNEEERIEKVVREAADIIDELSKLACINFCKDCRYYVPGHFFVNDMVCNRTRGASIHKEPNDFCSRWEKRDENISAPNFSKSIEDNDIDPAYFFEER